MRLRILGLLRSDGPATATTLAARLGLNSGATSYHLRQLAQGGFVVDDHDRGNARDRWWKAAHQSTVLDRIPETDEERETTAAYLQAIAVVYTERLQRAVEEHQLLPVAWQRASTLSDWGVRLTPERAQELREALESVVSGWEELPEDTEGAVDFVVQLAAFPRPGKVAGAGS